MDATMIVTFSVLVIVLAACAYVTVSVMRNIDKIGDLPAIKSETISKFLFNFYAVAVLCMVVVIRYLKFVETDGFVVLLSAVLGGLGFKFTRELRSGSGKGDNATAPVSNHSNCD